MLLAYRQGGNSGRIMITKLRFATASAMLILIGCAAGPDSSPQWAKAPDIDVAGYATFGWADRDGKPPVTILDSQIREAIRAELTAKGYVESSQSPDFLVGHEAVEQEFTRQGSPVRIGVGVGTGGGNVGGRVGTSVGVGERNRVTRQLRVTIRALDREDQREAWVGTTPALAERPDESAIDRAVAGVMKGFPERRG